MATLKNNLKTLGQENIYKGILSKQEFETHWTTFFDLYDTLESFGSHLTKVSYLHVLSDQYRQYGRELKFFIHISVKITLTRLFYTH